MTNKWKKLICLLLCLVIFAAFACTLAACEEPAPQQPTDPVDPVDPGLTAVEKEALRKQLLTEADVDLSRAELEATLINDQDGTVLCLYAAWEIEEDDQTLTVNADVILAQYDQAAAATTDVTVMFVRGEDMYGANTQLEISGEDKIAGVKQNVDQLIPLLETMSLDQLLEMASEQTGLEIDRNFLAQIIAIYKRAGSADLSELLIEYFTSIIVADDGYTLYFNFNKLVDKIWNALYLLAGIIDDNHEFSISVVYESEQFIEAIAQTGLTGVEIQALIDKVIGTLNEQLPANQQIDVVALPAEQDETAYEYLGKYLALELEPGVTVGSVTVGELLCKLFNTNYPLDLTDLMDVSKVTVLTLIKQSLSGVSLALHFDKYGQLTEVSLVAEDALYMYVTPVETVTLIKLA